MRAIVVDDEKLSLMRMERILSDIPEISGVAGYKNPLEALERQTEELPDIAFLDVEMPEMDGLELCNRLTEKSPGIEVIFVTAHDKYALAAYKQNAIGYLLKPVQPEDVRAQVNRVLKYRHPAPAPASEIYCKMFGTFYVSPRAPEADYLKFRTEKSEELLAFLLSQKGNPVSRDTICDTLWPEMELSKAARNFHTTAYNIRHTFHAAGFADVLVRVHDCYRINRTVLRSDLETFYTADGESRALPALAALEAAVAAYDGPYLAGKDYIWLVDYQSCYEQMFERIALALCTRYMQNRAFDQAQKIINKLFWHIPLSEEGYKMQLAVYTAVGKHEDARLFKEKFCKIFVKEMGVMPFESLKNA